MVSPVQTVTRRWPALLLAALSSTVLAAETATTATEPAVPAFDWRAPMTVRTLPFGNALYEHYRQEPFAALTALMVAADRKQLAEHETAATALLGSLQLQYGMLAESEKVLTGSLAGVLPEPVREQVLVNLAKVRYRAHDSAGSLQRLDALPPLADPALRDEVALMRANMMLSSGNAEAASAALANVAAEGEQYRYALFNLGVAQLQQQQPEEARTTFATLLAKRAADPVSRSLRDRTYLALGYAQLRQQDAASAREQLSQVRLQGPYSNSALLGLGWSYAQSGLYGQALTPWLELLERRPADLAVQEARLAVPFAYQSVQALPDALAGYQSALAAFEGELEQLAAARKRVNDGQLRALLPVLVTADPLTLLRAQGHGDEIYLIRLLSKHDFTESLRRYQDLLQLHDVLGNWQRSLPVYDDMLRNHRQRYAERAPKVEAALAKLDLPAYEARLATLREQVMAAQQLDNWQQLANAKERATLQRLERASKKLEKVSKSRGPMQKEADRLRLLRGVQLFDLIHDSADRQWQQRRALRDAEQAVASLSGQQQRLIQARDVAANRFSQYEGRIARQQNGADALMKRAENLMKKEAGRIDALALTELDRWQKQMQDYRLQAQLALARLQDRASLGNGGAP